MRGWNRSLGCTIVGLSFFVMATQANAITYKNPFSTPGITISNGFSNSTNPSMISWFYYMRISFDSSILGEVRNVRVAQAGVDGFDANAVTTTGNKIPMYLSAVAAPNNLYRFSSPDPISYLEFTCSYQGCNIADLTIDNGPLVFSLSDLKVTQNNQTNPDPDNDGIIDLAPGAWATLSARFKATNIPLDSPYVSTSGVSLYLDGTQVDWRPTGIWGQNGDGYTDVSFDIVPPATAGVHTWKMQLGMIYQFPEARGSNSVSIQILTQPNPTLDLGVGSLNLTQNGLPLVRDSEQHFVTSPNSTVRVEVPISGSGFNNPETRITTVTLQAGLQPLQSKLIKLEDINSGATRSVFFDVNFGPQDAGLQTIVARIDPGNALSESNFSNNVSPAQVKVVSPYRLVAYVNGKQVQEGGSPFQVNPSDFATNVYNEFVEVGSAWPSQPQSVQIACMNTITGDFVSGCRFRIQPFLLGSADPYSNGGHDHEDSRPYILSGTEAQLMYDGAIHSVDDDGQTLKYWSPIISGDVVVNISGFDQLGNPIEAAAPIAFRVKVPGLKQLSGGPYGFKCFLDPENSGCPDGGYEHENFYNVTSAVDDAMFGIAAFYNAYFPDASQLVINDGSLAWGGLYDFKNNWKKPHRYHRQGTDIDIRSSNIPDDLRDKFEDIVCKYGGYPDLEKPYIPGEEHYHLYFYVYSDYQQHILSLCPKNGDSQ